MAHLIDKDALVAEINRLDALYHTSKSLSGDLFIQGLFCFIDTLETKEVDLEEALSDLDKDIKEFVTTEEFENESTTAGHYWVIAKHAISLGLKAQKGEEV